MRQYRRVTKKKLGHILLENGIITRDELDEAVSKQKSKGKGKLLGEILVDLGYATEEEITAAVSSQYAIPYISIEQYEFEPSITRIIPEDLARKHRCIPLDKMGDILTLAIENPLDELARKEIEKHTGLALRCFTVTSADILKAINKIYRIEVPEHVDLEGLKEEKKISTYKISENGMMEEKK